MNELMYASAVVFVASVVQSITGSGFAIIAAPFLLILYNSVEGVQVSILLSLLIALVLTPKIKEYIDLGILKRFFVGSLFGAPLGLFFFANTSLGTLKLTIAIVVLGITVYSLAKYYREFFAQRSPQLATAVAGPGVGGKTKVPPHQEATAAASNTKERFVGFLAGALTTSVNMPGVPTSLYFNNGDFKNEVVRSTTLGFFITTYLTGLFMQMLTVGVSDHVFTLSATLAPAVFVGIWVGNVLFKRINRRMFQLITNIILLYMGTYIVVKSI